MCGRLSLDSRFGDTQSEASGLRTELKILLFGLIISRFTNRKVNAQKG